VLDTASPVALRWTALDPGDTTLNAFLGVNRATNWTEFREGLGQFVVPSLNFVYADIEGNIGYLAPGRIPIRAQGEGMFPAPGWDSAYEWTGWIPFDELPQVYNPPIGYIATANNRIVNDDYPYIISNSWAEPYRAERIVELIEEMSRDDETISMHDMRRMQSDQVSNQVRALLPFLLTLVGEDERQNAALERLQAWDGHIHRASVPASIYEAWFVYLGRAMFEDDLSGDLYQQMAERNHPIFLQSIMEEVPAQSPWCDNALTAPIEDCSDTARLALDQALDDLEERLGKDMDGWQWGKVLRTYYPHNPFSEVPLLRPLFERSIANGGDKYTINVSPIRLDRLYDQTWVPSYRQLVSMSDLNQSLYMHTTGQSGNLLSRHYDDLIERHRNVEYLDMLFGRAQVYGDVLRLEPR
jgi:penicillin amidase